MRVCVVYDCLFPYTVGGAERWYRNLSERLARDGHEVTYLTLRQWAPGEEPAIDGVRVVAVGPRMPLYAGGRRRVLPPIVFGLGVLRHLLRFGRGYAVVHTASFPYFSLLAAGLVRPAARFRLIVDWHEVWTREYWREYLGPRGGAVGWSVQRLCLNIPQRAFCFSRLHERRLRALRVHGDVTLLEGEYAGELTAETAVAAEPVVVFAGRHIPEKRVLALVPAVARAAEEIPDLRCEIYGDGPDRGRLLEAIEAAGLRDRISAPGFVETERVEAALRQALCMVLPSRREGYGMVVVEASALGTPSVVVADPDNAAAELVDDGENGVVAASASADDLAAAIVRVHLSGYGLRESTAAWFGRNAQRLSIERSLETLSTFYGHEDDRATEAVVPPVQDQRMPSDIDILGALEAAGDQWQFRSRVGSHQYLRLYRLARKYLPPGAAVLDWGAASGHFSYFLLRSGYQAIGYSLFDEGLSGLLKESGYQLVVGSPSDPATLPFADESFDAVASIGVLEHVRETGGDEIASLSEIRRVLKPGGVFLCYHLPNRYSWIDAGARLTPAARHHTYRFTRRDIRSLVQSVDMELAETGTYAFLPRNPLHRLPDSVAQSEQFARVWDRSDALLGTLLRPLCTNHYFVARKQDSR